jgi:hypothetical protein
MVNNGQQWSTMSTMVNNATNINNNLPPQIIEHKTDTGPAQNYCGVILVYGNKYKQTLNNMHRDASTKELLFFSLALF